MCGMKVKEFQVMNCSATVNEKWCFGKTRRLQHFRTVNCEGEKKKNSWRDRILAQTFARQSSLSLIMSGHVWCAWGQQIRQWCIGSHKTNIKSGILPQHLLKVNALNSCKSKNTDSYCTAHSRLTTGSFALGYANDFENELYIFSHWYY